MIKYEYEFIILLHKERWLGLAKIKALVDGAGTIGRRLIYTISQQDDMEIVGFTKRSADYITKRLIEQGHDLYIRSPESFRGSGIHVSGTLEEALEKADVVLSCLPAKSAEWASKEYGNKKVIYQGGEKASCAEMSFVADCNYDEAKGKDKIRVVSCNTTGLSRILYSINQIFGVEKVNAQLIRRGADPVDSKKGPMSQIRPVVKQGNGNLHGHHGPDVNTILPNLDIHTMAAAVPSPYMHLHMLQIQLKCSPTKTSLEEIFNKKNRIMNIDYNDKFHSTGDIMEFAKSLEENRRGDIYEVAVWNDSIEVKDDWIYFYQAIHQEAITVPETIDAIRAMFQLTSKEESMKKTDKVLNIKGGSRFKEDK